MALRLPIGRAMEGEKQGQSCCSRGGGRMLLIAEGAPPFGSEEHETLANPRAERKAILL